MPGQSLVVVRHAERGIDDDLIYRAVIEALAAVPTGPATDLDILAGSMGGMLATRFLNRYPDDPDRPAFRTIRLLLDTCPTSTADIKLPRWPFALSHYYHSGVLTSLAWVGVTSLISPPEPEPETDPVAVARALAHTLRVGLPIATSQAEYIASFDVREAAGLTEVVDQVTYLKAVDHRQDPLIRVSPSIVSWRSALPHLKVRVVPGRQGRWHTPWTSRPREIMGVANDLAGRLSSQP